MHPELQRLIDDCYDAFAPYPPPRSLHALRDPVAILATLTSAPLRELTGEQIGPYAGWAMTTVGDVTDYKHFLPRILEQAVRESLWTGHRSADYCQPPEDGPVAGLARRRTWSDPSVVRRGLVASHRGASR